jgi:hypothetical protein
MHMCIIGRAARCLAAACLLNPTGSCMCNSASNINRLLLLECAVTDNSRNLSGCGSGAP